MAKNTNPISQISADLKLLFSREVEQYVNIVTGDSMFTSTKLNHNLEDIKNKYYNLGTAELQKNGLGRVRSKQISRETFRDLMEEVMNDVQS